VPELPEVETVVRDLRPRLIGRVISSVRLSKKSLRRAWSAKWKAALLGQRIAAVSRHGKWIFIALGNGRTMVIHLGMTGQLTVVPGMTPLAAHTHVIFGLDGKEHQLRFRDVRRFGAQHPQPQQRRQDREGLREAQPLRHARFPQVACRRHRRSPRVPRRDGKVRA